MNPAGAKFEPDAVADFEAAFRALSDHIRDAFTPALVMVQEVFASIAPVLRRILELIDVDESCRRYAIEHMDIPESDIKRIDFTSGAPVVVLRNWRRIPIELALYRQPPAQTTGEPT
jgi:hypothetical protein